MPRRKTPSPPTVDPTLITPALPPSPARSRLEEILRPFFGEIPEGALASAAEGMISRVSTSQELAEQIRDLLRAVLPDHPLTLQADTRVKAVTRTPGGTPLHALAPRALPPGIAPDAPGGYHYSGLGGQAQPGVPVGMTAPPVMPVRRT